MLRGRGVNEDGQPAVVLIIGPENLKAFRQGRHADVVLNDLLPADVRDALGPRELHLVLDVCFTEKEFDAVLAKMLSNATEDGANVIVEAAEPERAM